MRNETEFRIGQVFLERDGAYVIVAFWYGQGKVDIIELVHVPYVRIGDETPAMVQMTPGELQGFIDTGGITRFHLETTKKVYLPRTIPHSI